jgi:sensor histidine kinase YesM
MRKAIRTHRGLALFGGALVLATLTSLHLYLNWRLYGETASYGSIWLAEAIEWTIWAAFVPVVWAFERRLGTATGRLARAILGHAVVLLTFYGLLSILMTGVGLALGAASLEGGTLGQLWLLRLINHAPSAVLIYGLIVGAAVVVRVSSAHASQRAALETQLSEARLRYLRAQIQPHFLFNTLHGIAGLVREGERDEAVKIIGLLGRLLRRALAADGEAAVELADEIEDLRTYVDIQRMRFGDRLTVTTDVPPGLASVRVPGILLQPLVENSIRHGLGPEGGHVHVSAIRDNGSVVVEVRDDGAGFSPGCREGVGLGNLRARLEAMYGDAADLELENRSPRGAGVRIRLPIVSSGMP